MTKVLQRFNMESAKLVRSTHPTNCKLSTQHSPKTKVEKAEMKGALGHCQVDAPIPERHLERMPPIRLQ